MKYWRLEHLTYFEFQGYLQSMFNIERLIYNELTGDITKFMFDWFFSIIINEEFSICPGMGYENGIIEFLWTTAFKFPDCYKNVLVDLCDFSTTWTGYEAKYLDDCSKSNDSTIKLNKFHLYDLHDDYVVSGTVYPTSLKYCMRLPGVGKKPTCQDDGKLCATAPNEYQGLVDSFARMAYTKLGTYFWETYNNSGITN